MNARSFARSIIAELALLTATTTPSDCYPRSPSSAYWGSPLRVAHSLTHLLLLTLYLSLSLTLNLRISAESKHESVRKIGVHIQFRLLLRFGLSNLCRNFFVD